VTEKSDELILITDGRTDAFSFRFDDFPSP
jgi:hypothetical protein